MDTRKTSIISVRVSQEILDNLGKKGLVISDIIRAHLEENYGTKTVTGADLFVRSYSLPVGDVLCAETTPQIRLWWVNDSNLRELKSIVKPWEKNGFKLMVGETGRGSYNMPEVIIDTIQERKIGGAYGVSTNGVGAYVGEKMVWFEIVDSKKAIEFMKSNTNIPVAVRSDVFKYNGDINYKEAVDIANELFVYYFINGVGRRVGSKLTESDILKRDDL